MTINNDNTQITVRFFQAIDYLIENEIIGGIKPLTDKYGINRGTFTSARGEDKSVRAEWVAFLVRDFNVSAEWLLFGSGEMFRNEDKLPKGYENYTPIKNKEFVMEGVVRIYVEKGGILKY